VGDKSITYHPLTIDGNEIQIIVSPGKPGESALVKLVPNTNFVSIKNYAITTDTGKNYINIKRDGKS